MRHAQADVVPAIKDAASETVMVSTFAGMTSDKKCVIRFPYNAF